MTISYWTENQHYFSTIELERYKLSSQNLNPCQMLIIINVWSFIFNSFSLATVAFVCHIWPSYRTIFLYYLRSKIGLLLIIFHINWNGAGLRWKKKQSSRSRTIPFVHVRYQPEVVLLLPPLLPFCLLTRFVWSEMPFETEGDNGA